MKKKEKYSDYIFLWAEIVKMMPEFKREYVDEHSGSGYYQRIRYFNNWKKEHVKKLWKKYKKTKKISASDLFMFKLDLAVAKSKYSGAMTKEEALTFIKQLRPTKT